ncbi:MAG: PQQ-dependent sugar dehydrogenase [Candidatus Hydrogenedentes bacterium]|nr:PQQ-dependent sugar dehydrogenase [Candidatus Hydrogenedentota bacterium]
MPILEGLRAHNPYPPGFQESTIYQGSYLPTAIRFAPDGRYFVAEKYGRVLAFDSVNDSTFTIVHEFGAPVWTFHDHGLLGMAVDPEFPVRPYLYVSYTMRGKPGGRLSRIQINPATNQKVGNELVILEGWCAVYPSHSMGDLHFGPDGSLYMTYGDGASFSFLDWGQDEPYNSDNSPAGPCGCNDPALEGGALRSQDFRTTGDALQFNGALIRINPDTGEAMPDNPLIGGNPADDRMLAYGFRNPFRFTIHPVTGDVFVCDVGWNSWEEINRVETPLIGPIPNFGWPCYEGPGPQPGYSGANLPICTALYNDGSVTAPFYAYQHNNGSSATGAAVYMGGEYPAEYEGALFWGDYSKATIKAMLPDVNGNPDPNNVITFADSEVHPVDLQVGPNGDLFYIDISAGAVRRIQYFQTNHPPVAAVESDLTSGPSPLTVQFSGAQSHDDDPGDVITFEWDFDNDGDFSDSTDIEPAISFPSIGNYPVSLKVTDLEGLFDIDTILIAVDNGPPVATILEPLSSLTWRVGDVIDFDGEGNDPDSGAMDPETFMWELILLHCATPALEDCHEHTINTIFGESTGTFTAVEHEWPTYLRIRLTTTEPEASGLSDTDSVLLEPETVTISLATQPPGLQTSIYAASNPSPWSRTAIINDITTITAGTPQIQGDIKYSFASWSDSGLSAHNIHIPDTDTTYTATYSANNRPVLAPIGNKNVNEGQSLQFIVSGTDTDGAPPTFSMSNGPATATLTNHGNGTATFLWQTDYEDQGTLANVTFAARDANDATWTDTEVIAVTVGNVNPPPVLAAIGNKSVNENALLQFLISASDTDGTTPTLSATNLPAGASVNNNGDGTASFSWTPDFTDAGPHSVTFTATDTGAPPLTDSETVTITVNNVNRPPVLVDIPNKTVDENALLQFTVNASDPDGTSPSLNASNLPTGATFVNHGNGTATFAWTPNYSKAGVYANISVTASDGGTPVLTDSDTFSIAVNDVNRAPVVGSITDKTVDENEILQVNVSAVDPDGPTPGLSASNLPQGATFADNGNGTGTFVWQTNYEDAGLHSGITITAVDALDSALTHQVSFSVTVEPVNRKPVLANILNITATENELIEFVVTATDPDGNPVTLAATNLPAGGTFTDGGNGAGTFSWQTAHDASNGSPYTVGFTASDGVDSDVDSCVITINNVNLPVTLDPIGNKSAVEGELLAFNVTGSDPDGALDIVASNLPLGAAVITVQNGTIAFNWIPDYAAADNSPYSVTFTATDGDTQQAETIEISVADADAPGTISVVRPKTGTDYVPGSDNIKIKWSTTGEVGEKIIIELWRKGAFVNKVKTTKNDGKLGWDVPLNTPTGNGYTIRIRSKSNPLIVGESTGTFKISKAKQSRK